MSNSGVAAIWWRVSTDDQKEISPETQIIEAKILAAEEGFETRDEYVIGTDWHSLSVWDSPDMVKLRGLITDEIISAVVMYEADRGPSKPAHRLMMRALCEEHDVRILCRHGQVPDGEMGEVMEFLSAWSKEKQVHRAQQGAKDGLRDRAKIKGLPVNGKAPYGYQFLYEIRGGKATPVKLEPKAFTHPVAAIIWEQALVGTSIRGICKRLMDTGIPAPNGGLTWNSSTIYHILTTPVYGGRFYALRKAAKTPGKRIGQTYGKSTAAALPRDQWHLLEDFTVVSPLVSWAEWEALQEKLHLNKLQSPRNAQRSYLLAGMLFCSHDGRRLRGLSKKNKAYWYYRCTLYEGHRCAGKQIRGEEIETLVWDNVSDFLSDPHTFMAEIERRREEGSGGEAAATKYMKDLKRRQLAVDVRETELVNMKLRDQLSTVAYERNLALIKAERTHLDDEISRQQTALATIEQSKAALNTVETLRDTIADRLQSAGPEDRRWVLQSLGTRVTVLDDGVDISIGVSPEGALSVQHTGFFRYESKFHPSAEMTSPWRSTSSVEITKAIGAIGSP